MYFTRKSMSEASEVIFKDKNTAKVRFPLNESQPDLLFEESKATTNGTFSILYHKYITNRRCFIRKIKHV